MAVVKMRELLRNPAPVFAALEETGEPVLLTRNGEAVAALFPVDSAHAAEAALATLPEYAESRRRAENARAEGRTRSSADVLVDVLARHGADEPELVTNAPLLGEIEALFGSELALELASGVEERIAAASEPVLTAAAEEKGVVSDDLAVSIQRLNSELFVRLLPETLERNVSGLLAANPRQAAIESDGLLGRRLAETTIDAVAARVRSFNAQLVDYRLAADGFSLPVYEAFVRGAEIRDRT